MSRRKVYSKDLGLEDLQRGMWWREQDFGCIVQIKVGKEPADGTDQVDVTETYHKYEVVPKDSLVLKLDPDGNLEPPDGTELVVRGEAFVKADGANAGEAKKVAAFRKAA